MSTAAVDTVRERCGHLAVKYCGGRASRRELLFEAFGDIPADVFVAVDNDDLTWEHVPVLQRPEAQRPEIRLSALAFVDHAREELARGKDSIVILVSFDALTHSLHAQIKL
jgi:hypothetical protein